MKYTLILCFFLCLLLNATAQLKKFEILYVENVEFVNKKMISKGQDEKLTKLKGFIINDLNSNKTLTLINGKDSIKYKSVITPKLIDENEEASITDYYLVDKNKSECILRVTYSKVTKLMMFSFVRGSKAKNYLTKPL